MDPTCIKKVIMQNPWNPWLLLKVPKRCLNSYHAGTEPGCHEKRVPG